MKINGVEKIVPNLKDKRNYVIYIRALDKAIAHGLILEKFIEQLNLNSLHGLNPT